MSALGDIKRLTRGFQRRKFVEAVDALVSRGQNVPPGMKATPYLYADLAERYLHWTGKVLGLLQDAAYRRPNLKPIADELLETARRYFGEEGRWPRTGRVLLHPLALFAPAYYASRVGELLNSLPKPQLFRTDYTWANEFAREVLGSAAVKEIKEQVKRDTDALVTNASGLVSSGDRPADMEPFLSDSQREALLQARSGKPTPVSPPQPAPTPAPPPEKPADLEYLTSLLRGKVLRRREADVGGGVSGVISSVEKKYALFLYPDGTFLYEERTFTSVTSGGFTVPSEQNKSGKGTWSVDAVAGKPALVLKQDGTVSKWWHTREAGPGMQYLGDQEWHRYSIRE